jgi:phage portal protein BeeE
MAVQSNSFWNSILSWFSPKSSKNNPQAISNLGSFAVYPDFSQQIAIDEGFRGDDAVFAITTKVAKKYASIPRFLTPLSETNLIGAGSATKALVKAAANTGGAKDLQRLLNSPNKMEGADAFYYTLHLFKTLTGEAFIYLNRGDVGGLDGDTIATMPVLEMHILPSNYMVVVPDPDDSFSILGYIYQNGSAPQKIAKESIIHWKSTNLDFNPVSRNRFRGISPLRPGWDVLQAHKQITYAIKRMVVNNGADGFLSQKGEPVDLTPGQADQIRDALGTKVNTNSQKGSIAFLQGSWDYHDFSKSTDMKLDLLSDSTLKRLCILFDFPCELFVSGTRILNQSDSLKSWITNTVIPESKSLDDELNRVLLLAFDVTDSVIKSDFSQLPELQQALPPNNKCLTPNEQRVAQGYPRIEDPAMDKVYFATTDIPVDVLANEVDPIAQPFNDPNDAP